jgi:AraC-like DNA-binding protein
LKDLAETLSINTRLVSGAIKSKLGMGFPEYINKVRFGYLENLIERDPSVLDFSIDAMAKMIGFSSRSGFYKAFKNHSNYDSPNQMIENLRRNK